MRQRKKSTGRSGLLCLCFCLLFSTLPVYAAGKEKLFLIPDYEKAGAFPAGRARNGYLLVGDKLYLDTEKKLLCLDRKSGEVSALFPFGEESPGCDGDFCKWGQFLYVAENTTAGGKLWKVDEKEGTKELLRTPGYDKIWEVHVQNGELFYWGNRENGSYLYSGYELKEDGRQGKRVTYEDAQIAYEEKKLALDEHTQILYASDKYALGVLPAEDRPGQKECYYCIQPGKSLAEELPFGRQIEFDGLDAVYFYYHYEQEDAGVCRVTYCRQLLPTGGRRDVIGVFPKDQVWDLSVIGEQVYYKLKKEDGSVRLMGFPAGEEAMKLKEIACLEEPSAAVGKPKVETETKLEAETKPETETKQEPPREAETKQKAAAEAEAKTKQKTAADIEAGQETAAEAEAKAKQKAAAEAEARQKEAETKQKAAAEAEAKQKVTAETEVKAEQETAAEEETQLGTAPKATERIKERLQDVWSELQPEQAWDEQVYDIAFQDQTYVDILLPGKQKEEDRYLFFNRRNGEQLTILDIADCDLQTLIKQLERSFDDFKAYPEFTCGVREVEEMEFLPQENGLQVFLNGGEKYGRLTGVLPYRNISCKLDGKTS